jgi:hypothetical protein
MILISHRGNLTGKNTDLENNPEYIDTALTLGYDVEIDLWVVDGLLYLGHDEPQYEIELSWILDRINNLWVHCKNINSVLFIKGIDKPINYFWHEEDTLTLTSHNHLWVYPGKQPIKDSISVLPEIFNDDVSQCIGICSDYIKNYDKTNNI